jgi:hypothetical protein
MARMEKLPKRDLSRLQEIRTAVCGGNSEGPVPPYVSDKRSFSRVKT